MTVNLTTAAPILIGCPDHHANTGASAETTVRRVSKFNGQTDNVSGVFRKLSLEFENGCPKLFLLQCSLISDAHQVNLGVLSPAQVIQGKVMHEELADNRGTARSKGNY